MGSGWSARSCYIRSTSTNAPHRLSAFNTATPDGLRYFKACVEFLVDRYSQPKLCLGRAVNFNRRQRGEQPLGMGEPWRRNDGGIRRRLFAHQMRVCDHRGAQNQRERTRLYISLEHHWNVRFDGPSHSFEGRRFVDYFNGRAKAGGNFGWNLAYHPYPENLTDPRTWNDKTATLTMDTRRITFKNLEMLPYYFNRKELLFEGKQRHIILSEQGFNTRGEPEGELWQAAGYCYAYYKIARIPGIDSFILHRHVDNRDEFV